jgi:hypothetical protein
MDPIEDVKDRLLTLLRRRDPAFLLFRIANTEAPADVTRRGVNAVKAGLVNEYPRVTIDAADVSTDTYATEDATIDQFSDHDDHENDTEFSYAQDYELIAVHEGVSDRKNSRTDLNIVAALLAGGPKLEDPGTADSALEYVYSWRYTSRRRKQWDGPTIRAVTIFTITVNMVLRRSEILSIALPDPSKKGEI